MCGVWPLGLGLRWETHPGLFCLPVCVGWWGGRGCGVGMGNRCLWVPGGCCGLWSWFLRGVRGWCPGPCGCLWGGRGVGGGMLSGSGATHRPGLLVLMIVSWAWLLACGGRVVVLLVWLLPAPVWVWVVVWAGWL